MESRAKQIDNNSPKPEPKLVLLGPFDDFNATDSLHINVFDSGGTLQ
jgi:hypothetical protein